MSHNKYKATGKVKSLGEAYDSLDSAFKSDVDQIIDSKGDGHCLLRLLRLTSKTQTPTELLCSILGTYDKENHYFEINGHHLNVTLEDILYLTGLPINGKAVISSISRDKEAFQRVFTSLDRNKAVTLVTLKEIVANQSKERKERLIALLLIVIVCFVTPVCDDYIVHNYLVQFVEKLDEVDGYAWGDALLSTFYCAIENDKESVDATCWPLLAFFCIRIPKLCEELDFQINLEDHQAPLLNACMTAMRKISANKRNKMKREVKLKTLLANVKDEEIKWHPYDDKMLDDGMRLQLPFVTFLAPVICMNCVAYHRPLIHLRQFKWLEEYVGKSVDWNTQKIKLKQNKGDSNQDYVKIYARELTLWEDRKPVEEFIRKSLEQDDSQPLRSHSYQHSPQSQHSPILSSSINSQSHPSHSYQHSPPDTAAIFSSSINQLSHNSVTTPQSRNSYRTPSRNRPPVLTVTRTFVELLDELKLKGEVSYYSLEDFTPPSHY